MIRPSVFVIALSCVIVSGHPPASAGGTREGKGKQEVSFTNDVLPVFRRYCLPCHAEENFNPSELSLDTYDLLMKGGEHGAALTPGKPEESLLITKLADAPPFGDRMPLPRRRRSTEPAKRLTAEEVRILSEWIRQGAQKN